MKKSKSISLLLILFVFFIDIMGIGLVYPMFSSMLYQDDCHLIASDVSEVWRGFCLGGLLAAMPLMQFFSAPILGILSDQKGRRKVLLPSLMIGVLGYFLAVFAVSIENLFLLIISRLAVGISAGTSSVVGAALADMSTPENKGKNFGLFNMAGGLGFAVGPFLGGCLSNIHFFLFEGYAVPFFLAGLATLLNLVFIALCFEDTYAIKERKKMDLLSGLRNIQRAFEMKNMRAIFFSVFVGCMGWSFYWEFTPVTWITEYHFDTQTIGNLFAYGAIIYALSAGLLIRPIIRSFSTQNVLLAGYVLCGTFIGILLIHRESFWLWVYMPLQQYAMALFWPSASTLVSNSVSEDVQGEMLGVLHSVDALAFGLSPLLAGPLLGLSPQTPIIIGSLAMFLASFILWRGLCRHKMTVNTQLN